MEEKNLTIGDIAQALHVSKTTVSRAMSGKGRIGEETRRRVLDYVEAHHYSPNVVAQGLAQNKTFNIGVVMPGDSNISELPFFQSCMLGICRTASAAGYDVLISMVTGEDISQLRRAVTNRKVDGVILTRTLTEDASVRYLMETEVPFVAVGSTDDGEVIQVDSDHRGACRELTDRLLAQGLRKIALIGGDERFVVTGSRLRGFQEAVAARGGADAGIRADVTLNVRDMEAAERAVERLVRRETECIVCMDDFLCGCVLNALQARRIAVPGQMQVASFYDSTVLENRLPPVTSIRFDMEELGGKACGQLLHVLNGEPAKRRVLLGYEVRMRESAGGCLDTV